ncbi:MAG TPA: flagellar FlbD family protein [Gaiellales bacterium]|nr:flagellar FlbD family protein [Gaiellales bacterium]
MIALHRLVNPEHPLYLNPDLLQQVEANPDTVVTLTNGSRFVVAESPGEVADLVADWRADVIARALGTPLVANHPRIEQALGQVLSFPRPSAQQS